MTYQEGDPGHLSVHNALRAELDEAATQMGVEVVLPDEAVAGQTGHVDAHNLITDALAKIAAEGSAGASWAQVISAPDAVTSSYYDDKGGQWQYWEWNAPGTYDVEISGGILWVLCVSGGDGGASNANNYAQNGQPGLVREGLWEFGPGTHTVTVGDRGATNAQPNGKPSFIDDVLTGFSTQGETLWGSVGGRGVAGAGYVSHITGDGLEYATAYDKSDRPGRSGNNAGEQRDGCVIIATRIDVPTLPPAPPRLEVAPVVAAPVSISGPAVQEWLVRDKQGARKVVYFLPGNTGAARSLALTEDGAAALEARRDLLDAIATTEVPEDYEGDPVTLLPKKLRAELRGFVEVRVVPQPSAVFSVTLGAGVLPGVMVASGGPGGESNTGSYHGGGGGAGGVIGQGAHIPVILPVQGTATYTVTVGSDTPQGRRPIQGQHTTIAVQGQTPFASAIGGGQGWGYTAGPNIATYAIPGGSSGGYYDDSHWANMPAAAVPGQGHGGGGPNDGAHGGGGGGYGGPGDGRNGGGGLDLANALNLDPNDGITGQFLSLVSVDGWIAGGGAGSAGTATAGGGLSTPTGGKPYSGAGGGGRGVNGSLDGHGGAGAVYIITDPT